MPIEGPWKPDKGARPLDSRYSGPCTNLSLQSPGPPSALQRWQLVEPHLHDGRSAQVLAFLQGQVTGAARGTDPGSSPTSDGRQRSSRVIRRVTRCDSVAFGFMSEGVRYGDPAFEGKKAFLDEARRRYSRLNPAGLWYCVSDGGHLPLDDVLIVDREPRCPNCDASGWETVFPLN